jgi:hypothetical protein
MCSVLGSRQADRRRIPPFVRTSLAALALAGLLQLAAPPAGGQPPLRRATTVSALLSHPIFFHGYRVRVWGEVEEQAPETWLVEDEWRLLLAGTAAIGGIGRPDVPMEIRGTFWDVGRMQPGDPRLAGLDIESLARRHLKKDWPGIGELLLLQADDIRPAERPATAGIPALALEPSRFVGETITITGRFRGRNLYGDLPQSPGLSPTDFVLQSADAAVWVSGIRPRGRGFNLNVTARVDTDRWLEVRGTVRYDRGLVWIEGSELALAEEPVTEADAPQAPAPRVGAPPEVVFSAPLQDDIDVDPQSSVRIQFSRDMDPTSFESQVRVSYLGSESVERGEPQPPASSFSLSYDSGNRVLEIRFVEPLERFRTVRIDLLEEIKAFDGVPMQEPWTLTFSVGG